MKRSTRSRVTISVSQYHGTTRILEINEKRRPGSERSPVRSYAFNPEILVRNKFKVLGQSVYLFRFIEKEESDFEMRINQKNGGEM